MLHWTAVSQGLEPSAAGLPAQDPAPSSRLPTLLGLGPCWAWLLLVRGVHLPYRGQGLETQSILVHLRPKVRGLHQVSMQESLVSPAKELLPASRIKVLSPRIPWAPEASGSVQHSNQ